MTWPLDRAAIAALIPHAGAMCLLDRVIAWDVQRIVCAASNHRDAEHPLRRDGRLPAIAGVEYAAQAMAVHGGLLANSLPDRPHAAPSVGVLASLRHVHCHVCGLEAIEGDLTVEATRIVGQAQHVLYDFVLSVRARILVSGRAAVVLDAADRLMK